MSIEMNAVQSLDARLKRIEAHPRYAGVTMDRKIVRFVMGNDEIGNPISENYSLGVELISKITINSDRNRLCVQLPGGRIFCDELIFEG